MKDFIRFFGFINVEKYLYHISINNYTIGMVDGWNLFTIDFFFITTGP